MATPAVADVPTLRQSDTEKPASFDSKSVKSTSVDEEKRPFDRDGHVNVNAIGDVFADGPRLIDLGDDGKERPIGSLFSLLLHCYYC